MGFQLEICQPFRGQYLLPKDIQKDKVDDSIEDINEEAKDADDHGWQQQSLVVLHETIEDESEGDNVDQTPDDSPDKTSW